MEQINKILCGIYRHYKGGIYEVIAMATHSETLEEMVVYRNISSEETWVRPVRMWCEIVEYDEKTMPRFQYIAANIDNMDESPMFKTIEDIVFICDSYNCLSDNGILAFCHRETGEVTELTPNLGAYLDGDISEEELSSEEIYQLAKAKLIEEHIQEYVRLPYDGLWNEYEIMADFASLLPSPYSDKLEIALEGRGAFRRFKDAVSRLNLSEHWYLYRDRHFRREAREWCKTVGVKWERTYAEQE